MNDVAHPALRPLGTGAVLVSLALCLASAAGVLLDESLSELRLYLDVSAEANLPTWWSTILLLTAALAHGVAGLAASAARTPTSRIWFAGAAVLTTFSLAEHTGLHQRLDGVARQLAGSSTLTTDWLPLGTVAGLGVAATLTLLAARLGGRAGRLLGIGGLVLLGCELGGEYGVRLLERAEPGRAYLLTYHAAELGENIGALVLLAAALSSVAVTREDGGLAVRYVTQAASGVVLVAEPADGHQMLG